MNGRAWSGAGGVVRRGAPKGACNGRPGGAGAGKGAGDRARGRCRRTTVCRPGWDERGSAIPLTLMLGVSLLVLPVMVLVLTLPTWEERTVDAQDAARDAARALVTADNWSDGVSAANTAISQVVAGDGLPAGDVEASYSGSLDPGGTVTAAVTVVIPAGNVPGLGFVGQLHYTASSTEHVDSYRDSST
jgi:hypothetical protein